MKNSSESIIKMLTSGDEQMRMLAIIICKGANLKHIHPLDRIVMFLHSDDENLLFRAFETFKREKRKMSNLEYIFSKLSKHTPTSGIYKAIREMQELYSSTKKLSHYFYTDEETSKRENRKSWWLTDNWTEQIRIKDIQKQTKNITHGKK